MPRNLFVLLAVLFLAAPVLAAEKTLSVATLDWEPYVGQKVKNLGFSSELLVEAFRAVGYTVKIDFMPWDEALAKAKAGKYDMAYPGYYSKERAADFMYSEFYTQSLLSLCKRSDLKLNYRSVRDLAPYRLGTVKGYINTPEIDSAAFLKKIEADSDVDNLRKLVKKEVDLIVIDKLVALYLIQNNVPEAKGVLDFVEPPLLIQPLFCIFPKSMKKSEQLCKDFNQGMKIIKSNGTEKRIIKASGL